MSIFEEEQSLTPCQLNMENAENIYYPQFYSKEMADQLFNDIKLLKHTFIQEQFKFNGINVNLPRLIALYGKMYQYSGINTLPVSFPKIIEDIKNDIENMTGYEFNACLLNYYRSDRDSIGWHSDNEKSMGSDPIIASVTLGHPRTLWFRRIDNHRKNFKIDLEHGSLLIMGKGCQKAWQHSIPKGQNGERINLTFRKIF